MKKYIKIWLCKSSFEKGKTGKLATVRKLIIAFASVCFLVIFFASSGWNYILKTFCVAGFGSGWEDWTASG